MQPVTLMKGIAPWLVGVLLSTAAMLACWELGREVATLLGGEPGIRARIGKGLAIGVVLASLLWPVVRVAGVRPAGLIAASAVGFAVGYPLGQTVQGITVVDWGWNWKWGYGSALAVFALSLAVPQWCILRRHMKRALLWIPLSVTGWILTGAAWVFFGVNSGEDAIAYGLVTGLGLVWLVRSQPPDITVRDPLSTQSNGPSSQGVVNAGYMISSIFRGGQAAHEGPSFSSGQMKET